MNKETVGLLLTAQFSAAWVIAERLDKHGSQLSDEGIMELANIKGLEQAHKIIDMFEREKRHDDE